LAVCFLVFLLLNIFDAVPRINYFLKFKNWPLWSGNVRRAEVLLYLA